MKKVQLRGSSQTKRPIPVSSKLENETNQMEARLRELKEALSKEATKRESEGTGKVNESGSRWRSATDKKPLKSYANHVLTTKPMIKIQKRGMIQRPSSSTRLNSTTASQRPASQGTEPPKKSSDEEATRIPTAESTERKDRKVVTESKGTTKGVPTALSQDSPLNEGNCQVLKFLQDLRLETHFDKFIENGFDEGGLLLELNEEYLGAMDIPLGHQIKIMKKVEELRGEQPKGEELQAEQPMPQEHQGPVYEPLSDPEEIEGVGIGVGPDDNGTSGDLRNGNFDEKKNQEEFARALSEWRGVPEKPKSKSPEEVKRTKTVRFAEDVEVKGEVRPSKKEERKTQMDKQKPDANDLPFKSNGDTHNLPQTKEALLGTTAHSP
eukprot:TRINITY_DN6158_c0_g1_i1.p1 TRINITY_DN6158_c0_g1~~TRINITY_DN6158_c0_g1_i1.p1  ORF type:complete len:381 (+),score=71.47 TRINITY_DN6158_c0_g1_i1:54-1196(+)